MAEVTREQACADKKMRSRHASGDANPCLKPSHMKQVFLVRVDSELGPLYDKLGKTHLDDLKGFAA